MRGSFVHIDYLVVLTNKYQQLVEELDLFTHELMRGPEFPVELVGRLPPDDVVLSIDL